MHHDLANVTCSASFQQECEHGLHLGLNRAMRAAIIQYTAVEALRGYSLARVPIFYRS